METSLAIKPNRHPWTKQAGWIVCLIGLILTTRKLIMESELYKNWTEDMSANPSLTSLLILASIYMVLLSIPFLPGVELGILLMCVVGSKMVMTVYLFTVLGLSLSFAMGRWLPAQWIAFVFRKLDLSSVENHEISGHHLINQLAEKLLGLRFMRYLDKNPYWVIGFLLNLPGNFIVGGGGGIAMLSGLNRRMSFKYFVFTIALATLPLPLLVFLGYIQLERFL